MNEITLFTETMFVRGVIFLLHKWHILILLIVILLISMFSNHLVTLFIYALQIAWKICQSFLFVVLLAYFLFPLVHRLGSFGVNRTVAIILLFVWIFSIISLSLYFIYPYFIYQLDMLSAQLPTVFEKYDTLIKKFHAQTEVLPDLMHEQIDETIQLFQSMIENRVKNILKKMTNVMDIFIVLSVSPIILFYVLRDGNEWKMKMDTYLRKHNKLFTMRVLSIIHEHIGKYIYGQLIVMCIISLLLFPVYYFLGIPYALLFAVFGGIMNIIPYIGPFIGVIPTLIAAMMISWHTVFFVILLTIVVQIVEGALVSPFIIGKTVQLHPITVIVAVLIGAEVAGLVGMLLIIPLFSIGKAILQMDRTVI